MLFLLRSKIFSVLLVLAALWLVGLLAGLNAQYAPIRQKVRSLEEKMENVSRSNDYLKRMIAYLKEPSFLEKEARLKLNYKASEEEVVFVYRETSPLASGSKDETPSKNSVPNYMKWFWYLIGK